MRNATFMTGIAVLIVLICFGWIRFLEPKAQDIIDPITVPEFLQDGTLKRDQEIVLAHGPVLALAAGTPVRVMGLQHSATGILHANVEIYLSEHVSIAWELPVGELNVDDEVIKMVFEQKSSK